MAIPPPLPGNSSSLPSRASPPPLPSRMAKPSAISLRAKLALGAGLALATVGALVGNSSNRSAAPAPESPAPIAVVAEAPAPEKKEPTEAEENAAVIRKMELEAIEATGDSEHKEEVLAMFDRWSGGPIAAVNQWRRINDYLGGDLDVDDRLGCMGVIEVMGGRDSPGSVEVLQAIYAAGDLKHGVEIATMLRKSPLGVFGAVDAYLGASRADPRAPLSKRLDIVKALGDAKKDGLDPASLRPHRR